MIEPLQAETITASSPQGDVRIRLRAGSRVVLDESGTAIAIIDAPLGDRDPTRPVVIDDENDVWNPWRQGP